MLNLKEYTVMIEKDSIGQQIGIYYTPTKEEYRKTIEPYTQGIDKDILFKPLSIKTLDFIKSNFPNRNQIDSCGIDDHEELRNFINSNGFVYVGEY